MSVIYSIINQKGGVAKSTTAGALACGLTARGYKTLVIDLDAQSNLTYSYGITDTDASTYDVITGEVKAIDAIVKTKMGDIIPATSELSATTAILINIGKEFKLKEAIEPLKPLYDYIIIDTSPSLSILTINALTASDKLIIPVQADIYSLQGVGQLYQSIEAVKKYCNSSLEVEGILITRYNGRAILSKDMAELIEGTAEKIGTKVFNTRIRECISVKEAQATAESLFIYAPKSNASKDYNAFINELLQI